MTTNDCLDNLPPEQLVYLATQTQQSINELKTFLDNIRSRLSDFRDLGIIDDKLQTPYGSVTLVSTTTYVYSEACRIACAKAVEDLQSLERLDEIATKKISTSWRIKASKPQA